MNQMFRSGVAREPNSALGRLCAALFLIYGRIEQSRDEVASGAEGVRVDYRWNAFKLRGVLVVMWLLAFVPALASAQQGGDRRPQATRAELEALWAKLNPEQRQYAEAVALRERLDLGDFQVGDKVVLRVLGDTLLSNTYTVNANRGLDLPNIGEVPLGGVLRSELEDHLRTVNTKYIRQPEVHAESLMRITLLGQVSRPGVYNLPAVALLADAFTAAGGLTNGSDLSKTEVHRGGQPFIAHAQVQRDITEGRTLDQMNLHSGDELEVGEKKHGSTASTVILIGSIAGAALSIVALATLLKK